MGGMGANMRLTGKSGISFDYILGRFQGELQKSCESVAELHFLGTMNEIHETLQGSLVSTIFTTINSADPNGICSQPQSLPPVLPPQQSHNPI